MLAGSFILALLALLTSICPRRDGLRRLFGGGAAGSTGVGDHDYLPHSGGSNGTSGDGGSGDG